jgi:retron-type reverse transcriptase
MSEKPVHSRLRRLVDWINLTGAKKVHSLIDKVYKRKNLAMAWGKVKANRGSGGVDGQTLEAFEEQLDQQLDRLQRELKEDTYQPLPVRQHPIPKRDKPGEYRMLGIPAIYDRVCQQALLNRLEHFGCLLRGQTIVHGTPKVIADLRRLPVCNECADRDEATVARSKRRTQPKLAE